VSIDVSGLPPTATPDTRIKNEIFEVEMIEEAFVGWFTSIKSST